MEFDRFRPLSYVDAKAVLISFNVDDPQSMINFIEKWNSEIRHCRSKCSAKTYERIQELFITATRLVLKKDNHCIR